MEKLLRAVPDIGGIYLLVRPRSDGTAAEQRVRREVIGSNAFDRLRAALGPGFEKRCNDTINVISGDLVLPRFGLSEGAYQNLTEQVTLVINSAATVTFDERLDLALGLNILGPTRLLQFAKDCGDVPLVQVSTAYVSGVQTGDVPEELIPCGHTVASYMASRDGASARGGAFDLDATVAELERIIAGVKRDHADNAGECRRRLIQVGMDYAQRHGWHDTYTFTKWLAEQLLARDRGDVPLVIFRPAIIEGSFDEPAPGWIDGLRMADPLFLAFGRGNLAEFPADGDVPLDLIPVDFVSNAMIATLPVGRTGPALEVYQCGSSARNPVPIRQIAEAAEEAFRRRPMRDEAGRPIRVAHLKLVSRQDFIARWRGRLRRAQQLRSLLKSIRLAGRLRRRLSSAEARIAQLIYFVKIYTPYTHLNCRYLDDRLRVVYDAMHPADRELFPFDVTRIDWREYIVHRHVPGVRHFVLGSGTELEAPMLAASQAVEDEAPDAPPPMQVLAALRGESIFDVFENAANAYPKRIALQVRREGRWVRYTYADALATTGAIARRFAEYGLEKGDHVAICSKNCPEWGLTYLAAMRQGLTVVPFDPQLPVRDVIAMSRFADVKLICAGVDAAEALRGAIDDDGSGGRIPVVELNATFVPPPRTARDPGPEPAAVTGDDLASIVFTSGTTVTPRGVMLRHRNFLSNARSLVHVQSVHADDQFLSVLPLYHVFEFTGGFLVPIANASTVTYAEQLSGQEIISLMQATGTTVMMVVPRLLQQFRDGILREVDAAGRFARVLFPVLGWLSDVIGDEGGQALFARVHKRFGGRLRLFVCGGSALPEELFHFFRRLGFPVCEGYGLTETSPVVTVNPAGGSRAGSVGLPLPEIELEIHDQDATGVGELWVRGPSVTAGYYKNEQATQEVMPDEWFRTGDLCRRDADGFLYVTSRLKAVIITAAGKNVYPDEVEVLYAGLPHVKEMSVLRMPSRDGIGDSVDAVMVLDLESVPDVDRSAVEDAVRRAVGRISERLPSYQRIQNIHFQTADLPKTSTLKVKRHELAGLLRTRDFGEALASQPVTRARPHVGEDGNDAWLYETLSRLTGRPVAQIHPEANLLLDLGVDSLMKVELLGEIESRFGFRVPEQMTMRIGRVGDLSTLIAERHPVDGDADILRGRRRLLSVSGSAEGDSQCGFAVNGRTPLALLPLRWAVRGGVGAFFHSWVRVERRGLEHVPASGAFLLAANHCSHLDSAAVLTAIGPALRGTRRRVYVAGAQDYFFNTRFKAALFGGLLDTVPFNRDSDGVDGLRRCAHVLRSGQALLIFPEGTRSVTGKLRPFKTGAAVLAAETGVPIVPVRIDRTYHLLPKGNRFVRPGVVSVTFGEPVPPVRTSSLVDLDARHATYRAMAREVRERVESLGRREPVDDV